jgi:tetratricopeptide (TPR) repeat protein
MASIPVAPILALILLAQLPATEPPAGGQPATPVAPTMEQIQAAVAQLGADDFRERQRASDLLWQAGLAAEGPLREALKSDDPEVRFRAAAILDKIRFGILPNTPPDILLLIDQFRHGNSATAKRQALLELQAKGRWTTILALLRGEENEIRRRELASAVAGEAGKLVRPLIEKGDLDQALEVLELTAVHDPGIVQLTSALLLAGRLDEHIERLRGKLAANPRDEDWRRLAMYLRAKGESADAVSVAEKTNDKYLVVNLASEARQWAKVAALVEELQAQNAAQLDHSAFAATFYLLAGDQAGHERMIAHLQTAAGIKPEMGAATAGFPADAVQVAKAWFLIEALLVAERNDEALAILKKTHPQHAHAMLWRQHRHREALELVAVTPGKTLDRAWFDALAVPPGDTRSQTTMRMAVAGQVARELRELGSQEQVTSIVETLRSLAATGNDQGQRWIQVALLNWQLGRFDDAFLDVSQALAAKASPPAVFGQLLKQQGQLATIWFEIITAQDPLLDRQKAVERAVWLSVANPPKDKLPVDWKETLAREAEAAGKLEPILALQRLVTLADTALIRGDKGLARKYLESAAKVSLPAASDPFAPGPATLPAVALKLGDLAASEQDWSAAESSYAQAISAAPSDPLPLFLHGIVLTKLDRAEEGQRRMRLAELVALAPEVRLALASGLQERGHRELAAAQFEVLHRTAQPDSSLVANAAQQIGNLVNGKEPRRAAERWQELHLHVLNANSGFVDVEGYLTLPHVIHKVRAKAALAEGKTDEMLAELARCEKLLPGDVRLIVEFIPKLDKADQQDAADLLFAQAYGVHHGVCEEFPQSGTYLNNTAWLAARSQRRLDEALELSQKAIGLAPTEAAYHDTLAEVHFQRADRDAAVAAAKKALELAPANALISKRLKHFETSELKTLDRTESDSD